ncbi:MAG: rRNA maturation RNase YbeY [Myxococcota bacterium]
MSLVVVGPPQGAAPRLDLARLRLRGAAALAAVDRARDELVLSLVDDAAIRALNASYRGKDRATDVLSFSLLEGEHRERRGRLLGDVVISVETARRQARAARRSLDDVVARLLIHGLLHVLGHDHEQDAEARAMRAEERRLWARACA